jgi:hypothetical protein
MVEKFDAVDTDALDHWARRRAEAMAVANVSAAKYVNDNYGKLNHSSWGFNPYFGLYTYIPMSGRMCNPYYSYCYYSPGTVYSTFYAPAVSYNNGLGLFEHGRYFDGSVQHSVLGLLDGFLAVNEFGLDSLFSSGLFVGWTRLGFERRWTRQVVLHQATKRAAQLLEAGRPFDFPGTGLDGLPERPIPAAGAYANQFRDFRQQIGQVFGINRDLLSGLRAVLPILGGSN